MGSEVIQFGVKESHQQSELRLLKEQNQELRNSHKLLKQDLVNGMQGVLTAAQSQFNITSFNPLFQANIASPISVNFTFLNYFYKTHGIIQTAIEQPVLDALSSGDQTGSGVLMRSKNMDEFDIEELMGFMEDEDVWSAVSDGMVWARLFGGGAIIINDGASDFSTPLPEDGPLPVLRLYAASRWELGSSIKLDDPKQVVNEMIPGQYAAAGAEHYMFYGKKLHKSRVITLSGRQAPWMVRWMLQGWGMSEVEKMIEDFNMYIRTRNVLYDLLNEAKVDVFGIDGMRDMLLSEGGSQKMLQRIQTVQQAKNMNNALLMDKNDLYEQKQITFTGIAEVMKENRMAIASAVKMPISKIFGIGASGFSSGEDDLENYNSMVQSTVRAKLRKPIRQVLDVVMRHLWGAKVDDYQISFKPLRVMSAKDEEDIKDKKFNRGMAMVDHQMMTSKEMGELCHKDNLIDVETAAQKGELEDFPEVAQGEESADADAERQKDLMKTKPKESKEK